MSDSPPTRAELTASLSLGDLRALFLLHVAVLLGVVGLGTVIIVLAVLQDPTPRPEGSPEFLGVLSIVHAVVFVTSFPLAILLHGRLLDSALEKWMDGQPVQNVALALRSGAILRALLMEGPAMFGLVICLMAIIQGALSTYWPNALSAVVFLVYALTQIPTTERVRNLLEERFDAIRMR